MQRAQSRESSVNNIHAKDTSMSVLGMKLVHGAIIFVMIAPYWPSQALLALLALLTVAIVRRGPFFVFVTRLLLLVMVEKGGGGFAF